jgi:uridine phosphorylase
VKRPLAEPPILRDKDPGEPSVFLPEHLLREARRQRGIAEGKIPRVGVLDPDGDLRSYLVASGRARRSPAWACYHSDLFVFESGGVEFGLVGCAVGASFAVLVAEEMFASGCELLLSVTSSGRLAPAGEPPYFVVIEEALRDEGTSYHYLPPSETVRADATLVARAEEALRATGLQIFRGATWTTDAPFRETERVIAAHSARGLLAVEMEAAALYAFAEAKRRPVLCFAHVTNQMAQIEGDFEKGAHGGALDALALITAAARACLGGE